MKLIPATITAAVLAGGAALALVPVIGGRPAAAVIAAGAIALALMGRSWNRRKLARKQAREQKRRRAAVYPYSR